MNEKRTPLLAKIFPMFSARTEDVAVEALGYILNGSQPARDALSDVLQSGGAEVGRIAEVQTQFTLDDGACPDLAAFNEDGSVRILIESEVLGRIDRKPARHLPSAPPPRAEDIRFTLRRTSCPA